MPSIKVNVHICVKSSSTNNCTRTEQREQWCLCAQYILCPGQLESHFPQAPGCPASSATVSIPHCSLKATTSLQERCCSVEQISPSPPRSYKCASTQATKGKPTPDSGRCSEACPAETRSQRMDWVSAQHHPPRLRRSLDGPVTQSQLPTHARLLPGHVHLGHPVPLSLVWPSFNSSVGEEVLLFHQLKCPKCHQRAGPHQHWCSAPRVQDRATWEEAA